MINLVSNENYITFTYFGEENPVISPVIPASTLYFGILWQSNFVQ